MNVLCIRLLEFFYRITKVCDLKSQKYNSYKAFRENRTKIAYFTLTEIQEKIKYCFKTT